MNQLVNSATDGQRSSCCSPIARIQRESMYIEFAVNEETAAKIQKGKHKPG